MSRTTDIIPIESRRPGAAVASHPAPLAGSSATGAWIVLVAIAGVLALGVVAMVAQGHVQRSVVHLSTPERAAIFRRAYEDLRETCRLPEAAHDPLLERCRGTASFLLLFPECDPACIQAARQVLPQARR